jgi:hypothetical protein
LSSGSCPSGQNFSWFCFFLAEKLQFVIHAPEWQAPIFIEDGFGWVNAWTLPLGMEHE